MDENNQGKKSHFYFQVSKKNLINDKKYLRNIMKCMFFSEYIVYFKFEHMF